MQYIFENVFQYDGSKKYSSSSSCAI
jgi:hypothetical protein